MLTEWLGAAMVALMTLAYAWVLTSNLPDYSNRRR